MLLPAANLYPIISSMEKKGVFQELEKIYGQIPETTCEQCATCCTVPPPGYFIEYLNLYRFLKNRPGEEREEILKRLVEYYFLEMVDINTKCPFLSSESKCLVYPVRTLSCRTYGLTGKKGDDGNGNNAAMERLAREYREKYGIELPEEIVDFRLPADCGKVKITNGARPQRGFIEKLITDVAKLETEILPVDFVEQDQSLMPLASYLATTVLSEGARARRIKVMKEYLEKGTSGLLDEYKEKASKYEF